MSAIAKMTCKTGDKKNIDFLAKQPIVFKKVITNKKILEKLKKAKILTSEHFKPNHVKLFTEHEMFQLGKCFTKNGMSLQPPFEKYNFDKNGDSHVFIDYTVDFSGNAQKYLSQKFETTKDLENISNQTLKKLPNSVIMEIERFLETQKEGVVSRLDANY